MQVIEKDPKIWEVVEYVGNIVQTGEEGAADGWESYGEGYPYLLHSERSWEKLDIAFLNFLSFWLATTGPLCQENTRLGQQLYANFQFVGARVKQVKWEEQQHQS